MNEETLTLYYYGELDEAGRRAIEEALSSDLELARQYRELKADLDGFSVEDVPAPTHVVHRWHHAIDAAAAKEAAAAVKPERGFHLGSFFWGSAVAASLAIGIAIGVLIDEQETVIVPVATVESAGASNALARGLLVHFQESREQLVGLSPDSNGERTELIGQIIGQNRLFARIAKQNESQDLARVLRAFEPILVKLAAEDISPEEATRLQSQLAFELNIVLTKLSRQVSEETDSIDI